MNGTEKIESKKWLYQRDENDPSKNVKKHGYSAQKIDKNQKSSKNVKKHEKTREIEIQYIYI